MLPLLNKPYSYVNALTCAENCLDMGGGGTWPEGNIGLFGGVVRRVKKKLGGNNVWFAKKGGGIKRPFIL